MQKHVLFGTQWPECYRDSLRKHFCVLFLFLLVLGSGCSNDKKITFLTGDMKTVFNLAKKNNKKVFVLITAGNCGNCGDFESLLDKQKSTVEILNQQYLCYKVNAEDIKEREIAQIVKCPSYPFPYFFNSDGTLLAFGFPNRREYDITDLNKIFVDENRFTELFNLMISTKAYKNLVSLNMRATLAESQASDSISAKAKALELYEESLKIAAYPYNLRKFNLLSNKPKKRKQQPGTYAYSPTSSDRMIYGDLNTYMGLNLAMESKINVVKTKRAMDYVIVDQSKDMGKLKKGIKYAFNFRVRNLSDTPLILNSVTHPCDCIKLSWPATKMDLNQSVLVKGEFTPYETGDFDKEIYVHSSSVQNPMGIFRIKGSVSN